MQPLYFTTKIDQVQKGLSIFIHVIHALCGYDFLMFDFKHLKFYNHICYY